MKVFSDSGSFNLPQHWLDAAGCPRWVRFADVTVIAQVKADAVPLLTDRGVGQYAAESITKGMRLQRSPYPHGIKLAVEAGALDPDTPSVYVWNQGNKNDPIIRIESDGTVQTVGHFRVSPPPGLLYVEKG